MGSVACHRSVQGSKPVDIRTRSCTAASQLCSSNFFVLYVKIGKSQQFFTTLCMKFSDQHLCIARCENHPFTTREIVMLLCDTI